MDYLDAQTGSGSDHICKPDRESDLTLFYTGSGYDQNTRVRLDPDPKHCFIQNYRGEILLRVSRGR